MTTAYVSLNSIHLTPSAKDKTGTKIGRSVVNANGGRTWVQRLDSGSVAIHKRSWDLKFENVIEANRTAVENLFLLAATVPFVDENGNSYTVQCEADGYNDSFSFRSAAGDLYYTVSIKVFQI
jgi:hypothetical protein